MSKLVLELIADTNNLIKNLDRAQASVDKFVDSSATAGQSLGGGVNRALDAFTDLAKGGAAAAGVLAGVFVAAATAAVLMTTSAGQQIEAIDQLSQKTGIALQSLQQWSVIMAENGFQAETLSGGMRTLSKQMIEARNPASQAATTFDELGISITALGSTESTIRAVADKFKDLPDGADKARLAVTLFGKAGLDMIPMLNRGAAAFDASRAASERFGVVLSTQQVSALTAVDDASDRLGVSLQGLKLQLSAVFAGPVTTGIEAITNGIAKLTNITTNYGTALEKIKQEHPIIASLFPSGAGMLAAAAASSMPPPVPPIPSGPPDAHVADFALSSGQKQEALGLKIRDQLIAKYKLLQSEGHAQEALGKITTTIHQRETAERNANFAMMVEEEDRVRMLNLELSKPPDSGPFVEAIKHKEAALQNLLEIMPELTRDQAILQTMEQDAAGLAIVQAGTESWLHRNDALDMAVQDTQSLDAAQHALFQSEAGLIGASDAARQQRFALIEAEAARERARIDETIFNEQRKAQALQSLDTDTDTKRRQAVQAFPSFFESQMQAIVASNAFSMGSMVSTWTGGIAQMAVHGGNLQAVWEQTQVALVQAALNAGVQQVAQAALSASVEFGILSASEAAKMGLKTASEAQQTAAASAGAAARVAIAQGEATASLGFFATIGAAVKTMFLETIVPAIVAVGNFVVGVLTSIAAAMKATIFGIPAGVLLLAAVAGIVVALAATGNLGFKDGGIGDFGSGTQATLHGREAIIPLNGRGAAFMQQAFGSGGGSSQRIEVPVYLNGREIARATARHMPSAWRSEGAPA